MYRFSSSFKAISHSSVVGTSFLSVSTSLFPWVVLILLPSPCTFRSFAWSLYSLPHQNVSLFPPFLSRTTHTRVFIFPSSPSRRSTPSIASLSPPVIFPGVKSARLAGLSLSLSSSLFPLPSFFSSTSYRFFEEASLSSPTVSRQFFLHAPFLHSSLSAPNPSFSPRFPLTFTATGNRRSLSSFLQKDSPSLFFCCERRAYPLSSFSLLKKASCLSSLTSVYLPSKSLSLSRCSTRPSSSSLPSSSSFSALPSSFIPARLSPPSFSPVFSSLPSLILSPCASPRQTSFNPLGFLFCQSSFSSLILLSFLNPTTTSCSSSPLPRENRFSSVNCQRSSSSLPLKMTGIPSLPSSSPSSVSNPLSSSSSSSSRFSPLASACASASHSGREMRDREDRSVSPHVSPEVVGKILVTQTVDKKVFLTFFWSNTRINMERSADESVEKVLQRLRISCQKAEQKSMKAREGGRKEKKRKQQPTPVDHDTSSSSFGAQRGSQTKQDEERTDPLLPYAFLRRRDGSVIPLSDPCGRSFREATFACFSTEMPSTTTTPTSSSSDFSISSGKQKAEEAKEPHVASPNGLGEAEQEEEEKKKEEGDNNKLRREQRMQIVWDPPIVKTLFVAQALYTGCPVLSSPVFTGGDESDIDEILVEWRHEETPDHSPPLHCGRSYTPTENDEGKSLKLKAYHPLTPDFSISATLNPVEPCPSLSWHKTRMEAFLSLSSSSSSSSSPSYSSSVPSSSSSPPSSSFRVCSFNILASAYAKTPHAIQSMYPYCHHRHLDLHHRKSLLGKEIKDLHGDIIALQECEYHAVFASKHNARVSEGCALLIRKERFSVVDHGYFIFQKEFKENPLFEDLRAQLRLKWPNFETSILPNLTTIMQYAILKKRKDRRLTDPRDDSHQRNENSSRLHERSPASSSSVEEPSVSNRKKSSPSSPESSLETESSFLIVGNTHLFFHPYARHIRVLQIYVMSYLLSKLQEEAARTDEKEEEEEEDRKLHNRSSSTHQEEGSRGEGVEEEMLGDEKMEEKKKKRKRGYPRVILCGDFNCQPGSGGLKLLKEKQVDPILDDWNDGAIFRWERDEEVAGVDEECDSSSDEASSELPLHQNEAKLESSLSSSNSPSKTEEEKQEERRGKGRQGEHADTVLGSSFPSNKNSNDASPAPSPDSRECIHGKRAEDLSRKTREGGKSSVGEEEEKCALQGDTRGYRSCREKNEGSVSRAGDPEECIVDDTLRGMRRDREEQGREIEAKKDEEKNGKKEDGKNIMEEDIRKNNNNYSSKELEEKKEKVNRRDEDFLSTGGVSLELPVSFNLHDCYKHTPLSFSNYVNGFQATLDYIFASQDLQVLRCLPGVRDEDIQQHGGLPCEGYPSDHLSIAVDLAPSSSVSSS